MLSWRMMRGSQSFLTDGATQQFILQRKLLCQFVVMHHKPSAPVQTKRTVTTVRVWGILKSNSPLRGRLWHILLVWTIQRNIQHINNTSHLSSYKTKETTRSMTNITFLCRNQRHEGTVVLLWFTVNLRYSVNVKWLVINVDYFSRLTEAEVRECWLICIVLPHTGAY